MRHKQKFYQVFSLCILIAFFLIIISPSSPVKTISGFVENLISPIQKSIYNNLGITIKNNDLESERLRDENVELKTQLVKLRNLEKDLDALKSQFSVPNLRPEELLRAEIIGSNTELPGLKPSEIIISLGTDQGIKPGQAVIYKDNLLGFTHKVVSSRTLVLLLNNEKISFTAQTMDTSAIGTIKGNMSSINLENVLLSEVLTINDLVITKGDVTLNGEGARPGLIIGKISSIDKKPSALFQSAKITQLVNISKLSSVYVIIK